MIKYFAKTIKNSNIISIILNKIVSRVNILGKVYHPIQDGFDKENIQKKLRISFFSVYPLQAQFDAH